jgi:ribosomal protein S12 methylthiotransferase
MAKKIAILSLGCARNLVDSEVLTGRLKRKGYQITVLGSFRDSLSNGPEEADIALVNTCAFIKEAKEESIQAILDLIDLKQQGRLKRIIVAGCLSQRYGEKLIKDLPEIDAFLGVISLNHAPERFYLSPRHYAYVKICEGCINSCSFCVIPKIKSKFSSRSIESITDEIKALDARGFREINLIGQDITAYGWDWDGRSRLTDLIKQILISSKKENWLRLLYLAPERLSDELIQLVASSPRIVKYIDLPLQHINNRILRLMRRNINSSGILKLIDKIRKKIPDVAIRSTLIVGFPGETDREFKQLLDFVRRVKFERLGLFMYSREEGTPAFRFNRQLTQRVKQERYNIIMSAQQEIARQVNQRFRGKTFQVLIEERQEEGLYIGRSQYDAPEVDGLIYVKTREELPLGDFIDAKITDTYEYDLVGELL